VSDLGFLSPSRAGEEAVARSPLERALAHAPRGIEDLSLATGVLEVRGDVEALGEGEVIRLTPTRALVLCPAQDTTALRAKLSRRYRAVIDVSAGWAAIRVRGAAVLRRVTDLDLQRLPAVGGLAHVQALLIRDGEDTFRVLVPQEYGHHVAEVLSDAIVGLGSQA
jgi:heterotetrameric sarcosine oxidase gamma subunit